ncbi:MAG: hypothetical protein KU37_08210 [Sulfuricurvum sp. PC08-66]|nr:MAG: hypothetical protein KU37_08210 [Sulfuricurvum sp. PC08-66]
MKWLASTVLVLVLMGCSETSTHEHYAPTAAPYTQSTYVVAIHPYLNAQKTYSAYRPILDYLESNLNGVRFILETSHDYAHYESKLYAGTFDFSLPNPYQTHKALAQGYRVIAKMKPDSVFRGIFVARKEHNITDVQQLKDKAISFPAPTALAATMMPLLYLHERGIDVARDITPHYVGSQYSSILNAYSGDTYVGATWPPPWEAWVRENPEKAKEMQVIWETAPLVNNGFVVRDTVPKSVVDEVVRLLVALDSDPKGHTLLIDAGFAGFEAAQNSTYEVVERFIKTYDRAIGAPQ